MRYWNHGVARKYISDWHCCLARTGRAHHCMVVKACTGLMSRADINVRSSRVSAFMKADERRRYPTGQVPVEFKPTHPPHKLSFSKPARIGSLQTWQCDHAFSCVSCSAYLLPTPAIPDDRPRGSIHHGGICPALRQNLRNKSRCIWHLTGMAVALACIAIGSSGSPRLNKDVTTLTLRRCIAILRPFIKLRYRMSRCAQCATPNHPRSFDRARLNSMSTASTRPLPPPFQRASFAACDQPCPPASPTRIILANSGAR